MNDVHPLLVKNHFWTSLFFGVAFLAVLQTAASPKLSWLALATGGGILLVLNFFYNRLYLRGAGSYSFWRALRIPLLMLSGSALFLVIPTPFLRGVFLLLSVLIITGFESTIAAFSENLLLNESLLSAFGLFAALGGWAYLYLPTYRFYFALGVFVLVALLARCFFEYVPAGSKAKLLSSVGVALLVSQFFWAVSFLPFYFTSLALFLTAAFYVGLIVNYHYLFKNLDFKKIQFHLVFAGMCVLLVLLLTPWNFSSR